VNELMALCDRLEAGAYDAIAAHQLLVTNLLATLTTSKTAEDFAQSWQRIETHFDTLFTTEESINHLKQTILQLAVMGKLVPQDPRDEPAEKLLLQIDGLKSELVAKGLSKREKPALPIKGNEVPFDLPKGWKWARIGQLAIQTQYGTSQKSVGGGDGVPVLAMGNIQNGSVVQFADKTIPEDSAELPDLFVKNKDLLYNRTNSFELVGKTGIYLGDDDKFTFASYLIKIRLDENLVSSVFVNLAMNSSYFRTTQIVPKITKQTGQANVNGTSMRGMLIPLPPRREQELIVAQFDRLERLFGELKSQLDICKEIQNRFADVAVENAAR
jgi:type I restriction enzyme, S subunit